MNRGAFESSLVQQMMGGYPSWWSMSNLRRSSEEASPLLQYCPPPPTLGFLQHPHEPSNSIPISPCCEDLEFPQTWSQLLMGGLAAQELKYSLCAPFQTKKMENLDNQLLIYHSQGAQIQDLKQENSEDSGYAFSHGNSGTWSQITTVVSPRSCDASSFSSNMLNFSDKKAERKLQDQSSESNSTENGGALKKARIQGSSLSQPTTIKVRKEKLGDRITALHQIVSPFGKTDTASVLLEAFGYIRFLQSQIEALSSPYLARGSAGNMRQQPDGNEERKKDLRSRGLCLVPVSCTTHVENNNGADYWASSIGGGY